MQKAKKNSAKAAGNLMERSAENSIRNSNGSSTGKAPMI